MKKSLLISSLLLAAAGCSANEGGLAEAREEALTARQDLIRQTFVSTASYQHRTYDYTTAADGSMQWTERDVEVKVRLKFIAAENFDLDDGKYGVGLDYEVLLERFVEATGETFIDDNYSFFVKKTGGEHAFFNCGSTRRCFSATDVSR